jgi:hypothetical protein
MYDLLSGSDKVLEALRNPTISPEQNKIEQESDIEEETPLLKEILYQIAEIKGLLRNNAGSAKSSAQTVPEYTSQTLENL